jgi:hypothetical protein
MMISVCFNLISRLGSAVLTLTLLQGSYARESLGLDETILPNHVVRPLLFAWLTYSYLLDFLWTGPSRSIGGILSHPSCFGG